jgi:hypothetical protein
MHTAGARALRADDNEMSREAVLLQWEQKIEAAERREEEVRADAEDAALAEAALAEAAQSDTARGEAGLEGTTLGEGSRAPASGRFARTPQGSDSATAGKPALQLVEPDSAPRRPRFERTIDTPEPARERRTITITGQPTPARRRRSVVEAQIAQPDRIALWAFLLGLFLVAVAAGTAHA